jgi:hypothetical protein
MPKLNPEIYGADPVSYAEGLSDRILGVPAPTLDINGETDSRAVSEGNMEVLGSGRSSQGEPADIGRGGAPNKSGKTG